jgi:hypothetical protein
MTWFILILLCFIFGVFVGVALFNGEDDSCSRQSRRSRHLSWRGGRK